MPNNIKVLKSYNDLIITEITEAIDSYEIEIDETKNSKVILPNGKIIEVIDNSEINDNDETLSNIKNSFQIKDENIKQESFLDNKTNRIIITALLIGVIGAIISLLIPKKHK